MVRYHLSIVVISILLSLQSQAQYEWKELGGDSAGLNPDAWFLTTTTDRSGNVYGAGLFSDAWGYKYVAKWNGTTWAELGTGANALKANGAILSITVDGQDNIYAAGYFTNANGYMYVAKWNGSTWTELGAGSKALNSNYAIHSVTVDAKNNVYAAGDYVAKWDGSIWTELGTGANALKIKYWPVNSILSDKAGNIYAAGQFNYSDAISSVAKWNGTDWLELGSGANALNANGTIFSLAIDATGNIYAGGAFNNNPNGQGYVAKWDGSSWSELGTGANSLNAGMTPGGINTLAVDKNGNVYAAGWFINAIGCRYVARWDGLNWSELGAGCRSLNANLDIESISVSANNEIYVAGVFRNTNGKQYMAQCVKSTVPQPTPTFTQIATICTGSPLNPLPTISLEGFTGSWSPALDNTKTTTYTFTPDVNQCASATTMAINVTAATIVPTFTQVAPVCSNDSISPLSTTSLEGITGTWSPALNKNATTTYTFNPSPGQCAASTTMTVAVTPRVKPTFLQIEPICSGISVNPLPSTSIENITGTWLPAFNNTATTTYLFSPTQAGQCATKGTITVTVKRSPTIVFSTADTIIAPGTSITLNPIVTGTISSFIWTPSTYLNNSVMRSPTSTPQTDVSYTLTLRDTNGCSAKGKFNLSVQGTVFMPSAFSPNGDGKNDIFQIPPSCRFLKVKDFSVFDRLGKKVFSTQYVTRGWDGNINGSAQNTGTYVWSLRYDDPVFRTTITKKGTVVLIR